MDKLGFALLVGVIAYVGYTAVQAFTAPPEPGDNGPVKGYNLGEIVRATWDEDENIGAALAWMQDNYPLAPESATRAPIVMHN